MSLYTVWQVLKGEINSKEDFFMYYDVVTGAIVLLNSSEKSKIPRKPIEQCHKEYDYPRDMLEFGEIMRNFISNNEAFNTMCITFLFTKKDDKLHVDIINNQ